MSKRTYSPEPRRVALLALAALSLLAAVVGALAELRAHKSTRFAVSNLAAIAPYALRFDERLTSDGVLVDVYLGDEKFIAQSPAYVDPTAATENFVARYDGRFRVTMARSAGGGLALVEIDRAKSTIDHVRYRFATLSQSGVVTMQWRELEPAAAKVQMAQDLYAAPPRRLGLWSPYCAALLAVLLLVHARSSRPAVSLLAFSMAAIVILIVLNLAWPLMIHAGLRQTLPGVVIATLATLLLAYTLTKRVQQAVVARAPPLAWLIGGGFAAALLGVFAVTDTSVRALTKSLIKLPHAAVLPTESFVAGFLAPVTSALSTLLLPVFVIGVAYAIVVRQVSSRRL